MKQRPAQGAYIGRLIALITFGLLVAASITLYIGASRFIETRSSSVFEHDTRSMTAQMRQQITAYSDLLYSGRSLAELKPGISNQEWQQFFDGVGGLNRNKGVSSIAYLTYGKDISSSQLMAKVNAQAQVDPPLVLKPEGQQSEYAVVTLVASSHQLKYLLGGDVLSESARRVALEASAKSQTPQATPPLRLKSGVDGFLMFLPHQDASNTLLGFTMLSFRTDDLMEEMLSLNATNARIRVSDVTDKTEQLVLFESPDWSEEGFQRTDQIKVGGRVWEVAYRASVVKYQDQIMSVVPLGLMIFGLVCSLLTFIMILTIFRIRISPFGRPM